MSDAKFKQSGVAVGTEWLGVDGWSIGAAVAYQEGKLNVNQLNEQAKSKSYSAALYARTQWPLTDHQNKLTGLVGLSATRHNVRYTRTLSAVESQKLAAKGSNTSYQLFSELSWQIAANDQCTVEPFIGAGWLHTRSNTLSEKGGHAALTRNAKNSMLLGIGANVLNTVFR